MPSSIKLIIFDLDGTLMDAFRPVQASINYALKETGFPPKSLAVIKRSVGWGDKNLITRFVGEKNVPRFLKLYRRHHIEALKKGVQLMPGAGKLLRDLKRDGFMLAVASNRTKRSSLIALKALGIRKYFFAVVCGDEVRCGKPAPDMFIRILKKCSVDRTMALYIGDMTIDITAGKRAGIRTIAVTTGTCPRSELAALKPFKIIRSLKQFPAILEGLQ